MDRHDEGHRRMPRWFGVDYAVRGAPLPAGLHRRGKPLLSRVRRAVVVVAAPTGHIAVLDYTSGMRAPVCVARARGGAEALAIRIVASAYGVAIVEADLGAALARAGRIDAEVGESFYQPVAEILAYVALHDAGVARRIRPR